jgi:GNAT superfamily N-acetyltransferase
MRIRDLAAADEGEWRRLWTDYLAFYGAERPDAVYRATFDRLLDPAEPMRAFLAEADEAPIGLVHQIYHRHCWSAADICYMQDLYVDPDRRGQGVARALIERVYRQAEADGAFSVYWMTQEFNYAGRMLYDRVGVKTDFIKYQRP